MERRVRRKLEAVTMIDDGESIRIEGLLVTWGRKNTVTTISSEGGSEYQKTHYGILALENSVPYKDFLKEFNDIFNWETNKGPNFKDEVHTLRIEIKKGISF